MIVTLNGKFAKSPNSWGGSSGDRLSHHGRAGPAVAGRVWPAPWILASLRMKAPRPLYATCSRVQSLSKQRSFPYGMLELCPLTPVLALGTAEMTLGSSSLSQTRCWYTWGRLTHVLQAAQSLSQLFSLHLHGSSLDLSYLTKDNPPPQKEG